MRRVLSVLALMVVASCVAVGRVPQSADGLPTDPKATPAYGVLVLRKAAVEAELEDLSSRLTASSRNVRAKRFELNAVSDEMEAMRGVGRDSVSKLSSTYGNLILSKVALEVELNELLGSVTPEHPEVKKKKAELAALEREIENILK
jgi:uncharacterized protein involved in exopolysaccharide biosynthesis